MFSLSNIIIVFALTIAKFIIGALWHTVLFGKQWVQGMKESGKAIGSDPRKALLGNFLGGLVTSFVFCYLADQMAITTFLDGVLLGFVIWLGFVVATNIDDLLFEGQNLKLFLISNGYQLVSLIFAGGVYGIWY